MSNPSSLEDRLASLAGSNETGEEENYVDPELAQQQILDDPNVSQYVTRSSLEGRETVVGYFRVKFDVGQQRQVLHVPFVPPLNSIPQVNAHSADQSGIRVRVTDYQKFGIRTEIIRSAPFDAEQLILIEVIASEA